MPYYGPCQASLRGTLQGSRRTCDTFKTNRRQTVGEESRLCTLQQGRETAVAQTFTFTIDHRKTTVKQPIDTRSILYIGHPRLLRHVRGQTRTAVVSGPCLRSGSAIGSMTHSRQRVLASPSLSRLVISPRSLVAATTLPYDSPSE